jgi:L-alanine-DL-glutamate epimerase-like enolase superfamily enzyme
MMESAIGVGAAASLAAAYGTSATSDLDAAWWLARPANGGLRYEGSSLILPDRPGLGFNGIEDLQTS